MTNLSLKLAAIEKKLLASLDEIRAELVHRGNKGTRAEQEVRSFLKQHLPQSHSCGQGEIIDTAGSVSRQMDVIVTNAYHPFSYGEDTPGLYLIEGVSAAGEVKSSLDSAGLEDAIQKALNLRSLKPDHGEGSVRRVRPDDARFCDSPPFFLFAFETKVSLTTIDEKLEQVLKTHGRTLDAVFILGEGYSIDYGNGDGALSLLAGDEKLKGWVTDNTGNGLVLMNFLGWLHSFMPIIQRYTPVLPAYLYKTNPDPPTVPPMTPSK